MRPDAWLTWSVVACGLVSATLPVRRCMRPGRDLFEVPGGHRIGESDVTAGFDVSGLVGQGGTPGSRVTGGYGFVGSGAFGCELPSRLHESGAP